jgi:hypothetical protein
VLQSLKVKGSKRGWKSFHQALRSEWKQREVAALQIRLDRIGGVLSAQFLLKLSEKVFATLEKLEVQSR